MLYHPTNDLQSSVLPAVSLPVRLSDSAALPSGLLDIADPLKGKSTVSKLLSERHHLPIIDADLIAREVVEPGTSGYSLVVSHFGPDRVLQEDGVSLDRGAIGDIIFHDPEERKWMNGVVHPRVKKEMVKRIIRYWLKGEWCVILDVPLLIEAGMWKWVGDTVVVYVYVLACR